MAKLKIPTLAKPTLTEEVAQVLTEKVSEATSTAQDTNDQLDQDRSKLDQILTKTGTSVLQLEALINNLADFRKIFKQVAKDSIKEEVASAVKNELSKIMLENPDKVIIIYKSFWESVPLIRHFWRK